MQQEAYRSVECFLQDSSKDPCLLRPQKEATYIVWFEQIGFIQDRFNLDTIITVWESTELARETGQQNAVAED